MNYVISNKLNKIDSDNLLNNNYPYVLTFTSSEWSRQKDNYSFSDNLDEDSDIYFTKADVNYHYLSGSFSIPNKDNLDLDYNFLFFLDEKGIIFIDDTNYINSAIEYIIKTKKWQKPSLERFIYDGV